MGGTWTVSWLKTKDTPLNINYTFSRCNWGDLFYTVPFFAREMQIQSWSQVWCTSVSVTTQGRCDEGKYGYKIVYLNEGLRLPAIRSPGRPGGGQTFSRFRTGFSQFLHFSGENPSQLLYPGSCLNRSIKILLRCYLKPNRMTGVRIDRVMCLSGTRGMPHAAWYRTQVLSTQGQLHCRWSAMFVISLMGRTYLLVSLIPVLPKADS